MLAVTFTNRAAGEMRGRLRQLGATGVQARYVPLGRPASTPVLLAESDRWQHAPARRPQDPARRRRRGGLPHPTRPRRTAGRHRRDRVVQGHPDRPLRLRRRGGQGGPRHPRAAAEIAQLYATYEDVKRDRAVIDFEDVLLLTVAVLQDRHDIAEQVRSQYQHFVVDEYQDVSPLQQRLLELWLGDRDNLCVVGDASQTIYSFTGATPDHLLDFRTRHPGATVVKLVRDYRSTPQVVHLANGLLFPGPGPGSRPPTGADLPARRGSRSPSTPTTPTSPPRQRGRAPHP
ncbi:UvrD-helicase domain-containing protein [Streptomyces sp. L7]